jgi:HlyD family secretion protein
MWMPETMLSPPRRTWAFLVAVLLGVTGCRPDTSSSLQGYIEGEYVFVAAPVGGLLNERPVQRGDMVSQGQLLFVLESESEQAAVHEAGRHLDQAKARVDNLLKGRRPTELAALEAKVEEARASFQLARTEFDRRQRLLRELVISQTELDQVRGQRDAAAAALDSAIADLETGRLGAREDEVRAAKAESEAADAALSKARWALEQKRQSAPAAGRIHDTLYRPGEYVAAGSPVVALLPPENIRVRFFVPERVLGSLVPGQSVEVRRDGATNTVTARITSIATQAEFTPPVIYSRESRAKLVYMVEGHFEPDVAAQLRPGQPVDVQVTGTTAH